MFDDLADGAVRETDCLVAFYDITGFMTFARGRPPSDVLALCNSYFDLTGRIIESASGRLIKTLGDAGLCVFGNADSGVAALRRIQQEGDAWLREQGWSGSRRRQSALGHCRGGLRRSAKPETPRRLRRYGEHGGRSERTGTGICDDTPGLSPAQH